MSTPYDDIIHLPHPVSQRHARMSLQDRAAQFSPFAALTGYDAIIQETGRLTQQRIELGPDARQELDKALNRLRDRLPEPADVTITHFVPDLRKDGGTYLTREGTVVKISTAHQWLLLSGGEQIFFQDIQKLTVGD